ncbi:MAG: NAD(P)H-dependent oxidoreductase subunit E [Desulfobacterales bacterium]
MTRRRILEKYPPRMENLLLILHDLQNRTPRRYLSEQDLALVAGYLNTTIASIHGVAGYYSLFSLEPRGRHLIRVCRSPVCHMSGEAGVLSMLMEILGIDAGETTSDRLFTLETAECLGHCDRAPAMMIDETVYGELTPVKIEAILEGCLEKGRGRRSRR